MNATQEQIGGSHYKDMPIQPVEFIHRNGIPYIEGNVIKYVARWREKGGIEDIKKAKHYLELLIEMEAARSRTAEEVGAELAEMWGGETDSKADPLPWPERYEVGMRFRRKDGGIQTVSEETPHFSRMSPSGWWYKHGQKGVADLEHSTPQATLIDYLGKDTN